MVFSGVVPMFEFEFSNETENGSNEERNIIMSEIEVAQEQTVYYNGDSEIGVTIQIHAIGTAENVTIYNTGTREFIICTVKGKKSVTLLRNGVRTNILNCLTKDSSWIQLVKGDNILAYTAEKGSEMLYFTVYNNIIYEGV